VRKETGRYLIPGWGLCEYLRNSFVPALSSDIQEPPELEKIDSDHLYTAKEVSQILGISLSGVYNLIKTGQIPAYRHRAASHRTASHRAASPA